MQFEETEFGVRELCNAYRAGSLVRNDEYQRGAAWSLRQKQGLIDSIFRSYPLPSLFLEVKNKKGLGGTTNELFEIIDGQQRILALVEYLKGDYQLLDPNDDKLRLPLSLRPAGAPWANKRFAELPRELVEHLDNYKIPTYLVRDVANSDEVRDLFIRLQSGTALTRQQIRDAWPGQLGPRIEMWSGKLTRQPKYEFFSAVDGRGVRDEEDDANDPFVKQRTTCAQLCCLLLARQGNPWAFPSIKAADLDGLYHQYTQVDPPGDVFRAIETIFDDVEDIVRRIAAKQKGRRKVPKASLFALAMFVQDLRRSPLFKLSVDARTRLAHEVSEPRVEARRGSSGGIIKEYYDKWRDSLPDGVGINLDPKRLFDCDDRKQIWARSNGRCGVCNDSVEAEEAEYDHYPTPHRDGGRTLVENGRVVHNACHPRGRPVAEE
jgi:hypothetical protein